MGREGLTSICILELLADGHGEGIEPWMLQPVPGLTENGDVQQAADLQFLLCILLFQGPVGDMWGREIPFLHASHGTRESSCFWVSLGCHKEGYTGTRLTWRGNNLTLL